jgi:uncharacterized protein
MKSRTLLVRLINFYQKNLSLDTGFLKNLGLKRGSVCVFYPTCSEYSKQAIIKYGVLKGFYLSIKRIIRCHPWQKNHMDLLK